MAMRRKGFTLIELLVVMAIISMLAALLLPAIGDVRRQAMKLKCMSNMRQIGIAMQAWSTATNFQPDVTSITTPAQAVTYFQGVNWSDSVHNGLYCWTTDGSDGPAKASTIINMLCPTNYIQAGEVFYCPSFNRMTKKQIDTTSSSSDNVTYDNSWQPTNIAAKTNATTWWGYEWVNPRWPVTDAWVTARYPIASITATPTPDVVMFCHYSNDHACALHAGGYVESARRWMESTNVPFGW